jgi:UTP-glucose-1-phosphate uridylyltransferase
VAITLLTKIDGSGSVTGLVEKPDADKASSNLASIGRYVLTPDIFDILSNQPAGAGGEIQLADAINTHPTVLRLRTPNKARVFYR